MLLIEHSRTRLAMLQVDRTSGQATRKIRSAHPATPAVIGLGMLTLAGVMASPSPLVVLASGILAIFILFLLWRPGELPILLVPVFFQFTQVALKPVTTAFSGSPLQDFADFDANLEPAALFGLAGVSALALGLRIGAGNAPAPAEDTVVGDWPFRRILALSIVVIVGGHILDPIAGASGGARQMVLALAGVRAAGLFVLVYLTLRQRRGLSWLVSVIAFEIVLGMTGFFGDFKMTVVVLLCATLSAHGRLRARGIVALAVGVVLSLVLAVFWESGKKDYRAFLNQGTGAQVVLRPLDERLGYLADKVAEFDSQKFADGFEGLLARVSYIDFLAATMERVPETIPHEGGALLGRSILHVLTPRILFPDKPPVPSDTETTAFYTDLDVAVSANQDTSISIGYLGELYIDFGIIGAPLAVFLLGIALGRCYRAVRDYPRTPRFANYGLCMMFVLPFSIFEIALLKMIGSVVMVTVVLLALQRWVWPVLLSSGHVGRSGRHRFGGETEA